MAAYSAVIRGASEVYVVDRVPERLAKAKDIGCIPINFSEGDAVKQILDKRGGLVSSDIYEHHPQTDKFNKLRREVDRGVDGKYYVHMILRATLTHGLLYLDLLHRCSTQSGRLSGDHRRREDRAAKRRS